MSTQPIGHKGYGYTLKQSRKPREDVDFPLGPEQSKKRQDESGEQRGDGLRARIRALLADVSTDGGSGISFQDIWIIARCLNAIGVIAWSGIARTRSGHDPRVSSGE